MKPSTPQVVVPPAPDRPADAHKGDFGTVIVVGGSAAMIGAPALCAMAALRGGAGLVKLAVTPDILPFCIAIEPSATGIALDPRDAAAAVWSIDQADPAHRAVLAVGPGMGRGGWAGELVRQLLVGDRMMVLDADGLNLLAATCGPRPLPGPELIMTPHPGEFARLAAPPSITESPTDPATRPAAALKLAEAHRAVVVLKGRHTIVADGCGPKRTYVNATGNPALATAGSGDILAGLIAALLAQKMTPFDAAVLGAHLHGLAADLWTQAHGPSGLTARDLANLLPDAFVRHRMR